MTLIDFYVLSASDDKSRWQFACRLAEKAVSRGNKVLIATQDEAASRAVDELLWTQRPESFVPHHIVGQNTDGQSTDAPTAKPPVVITHDLDDIDHHDVLVNIRTTRPEQFSRFDRLAEIVIQQPEVLENTRQSYAFYKQRGYPVQTHKL